MCVCVCACVRVCVCVCVCFARIFSFLVVLNQPNTGVIRAFSTKYLNLTESFLNLQAKIARTSGVNLKNNGRKITPVTSGNLGSLDTFWRLI